MTALEILKAAKAKIATPDTWTQGLYARDASGDSVSARDPAACKWCALGATYAVSEGDTFNARLFLYYATPTGSVVGFNDAHTHADVMEMYDRAIAEAEKDAS